MSSSQNPLPNNVVTTHEVEDFVLRQDETLARLEQFLGFPLAKIEVKPEVIGRWKQDTGKHTFDFFQPDLVEHGYE